MVAMALCHALTPLNCDVLAISHEWDEVLAKRWCIASENFPVTSEV
jgi:hypothetical protein